jgi:hypothetical protein
MTPPDPPHQHPPTDAVRELLAAIHDYLDLPFVADWAEEPKRDAELQDRVAQLGGWLEVVLAGGTAQDALETVRASQGRVLPFTPETPDQTAERHAMLAAHLAERHQPGLTIVAASGAQAYPHTTRPPRPVGAAQTGR